jgi:hypothetical protein
MICIGESNKLYMCITSSNKLVRSYRHIKRKWECYLIKWLKWDKRKEEPRKDGKFDNISIGSFIVDSFEGNKSYSLQIYKERA